MENRALWAANDGAPNSGATVTTNDMANLVETGFASGAIRYDPHTLDIIVTVPHEIEETTTDPATILHDRWSFWGWLWESRPPHERHLVAQPILGHTRRRSQQLELGKLGGQLSNLRDELANERIELLGTQRGRFPIIRHVQLPSSGEGTVLPTEGTISG